MKTKPDFVTIIKSSKAVQKKIKQSAVIFGLGSSITEDDEVIKEAALRIDFEVPDVPYSPRQRISDKQVR